MVMDCNEEIMELIWRRMQQGAVTYGHGLVQNDVARRHNLVEHDWLQESLEEALDMAIYLSAKIIEVQKEVARLRRRDG